MSNPESPTNDPALISRIREVFVNPEAWKTPESRLEHFRQMDFDDDFEPLFVKINAEIRGLRPQEHTLDGNSALLVFEREEDDWPSLALLPPPHPSHRRELLREAFEAAQQLDDLSDISYLMRMATAAIHPARDANGRTMRTISEVLENGLTGDPEEGQGIQVAVEPGARRPEDNIVRGSRQLNPTGANSDVSLIDLERGLTIARIQELADEKGINRLTLPLGTQRGFDTSIQEERTQNNLLLDPKATEDQRSNMFHVVADEIPSWRTFIEFIEDKPGRTLSDYLSADTGSLQLDLSKLLPTLTPTELDEIIERHFENKQEFIELTIDVIFVDSET